MIIREAVREDLPAMLEIYNEVIRNTTAVYHYLDQTMDARIAWFEERTAQRLPVLVAEIEGQVHGFASYGPFRPWPAYQYTVEHSVHVSAGSRGKGVGKALLQAIIEVARQNKVHTIIAGIDADNEVSIALHAKLGFTQSARMKQVGWKFDRWLDLVLMQLIF